MSFLPMPRLPETASSGRVRPYASAIPASSEARLTKVTAETVKKAAPSLVVQETGQNGSDNIVINHKKSPFDNVTVRRAVNHALNRAASIQSVRHGGAVPGSALMPPPFGSWGLPDKELRTLPGYRDPARDRVRFRTRKAGILEVRRQGPGYAVGLPAIATEPGNWPEAVAALGAVPREVWRSPAGYNAFLYESEAQVRGLTPDFRALAALGTDLFVATAPGTDTDVVSRVFVPGAGIEEDPVTGSAHAMLAPIWAARLGRADFTAFQASARGGRIACRIEEDRVWLGGGCVTVVEGTFFL